MPLHALLGLAAFPAESLVRLATHWAKGDSPLIFPLPSELHKLAGDR
jgi:hypothetical protein